jgi:hypothetical protein
VIACRQVTKIFPALYLQQSRAWEIRPRRVIAASLESRLLLHFSELAIRHEMIKFTFSRRNPRFQVR